jgi:putative ABC transport system permease protein
MSQVALAWRLARRELRGGIKGFRVFLACLILGVAAITAVSSVRDAITGGLSREGAVLLGGDADLELTYRFASADERAFLAANSVTLSEIIDFRSMAVGPTTRGLTQVKAVDSAYPLKGRVELDPAIDFAAALAGKDGLPGGVMDPLLIARLSMQIGDRFKLGDSEFVLMAALKREPDSSGGFTLGPRTIVAAPALANSGLLQPGTLYETHYRLTFANPADFDRVSAALTEQFGDQGYRWRDARQGAPGVERFVDRMAAFLTLTGLAGLAVGGVGIATSVQAYLGRKRPVIATLKTLGAQRRLIFLIYAFEIAALAGVGIMIGILLGAALPMVLLPLFASQIPVPIALGLQPMALVEGALYGTLAAALFTLWPLAQAERVRVATLYRDSALGRSQWPRARYLVALALILAALVGAASLLTGMWKITLGAAGGMIGAFIALLAVTWLVKRLARRLARARALRGRTSLRLAFAAVGGPGSEALSVVLSLGLGLSVLASIGQIDGNLRRAIATELPDVAPSFFVVDIQPDQIDDFRARLDGFQGVTRVETAPMLRGVITELKGRPAREVAGGHWVVEGDRGLTYADTPPNGTKITQGIWWAEGYTGEPQVSFAEEEALEIGLALGDAITVNVLGRDIKATITSFREVKFDRAGMDFVMVFNAAALQAAPHTWLSTIYAETEVEATLLNDLGAAYPNITLIGVKDAIERVAGLLQAIGRAVIYGALATLLTGGIVLIGAAAAGEKARVFEASVLKTLGATRRRVLLTFALRSLILGLAAGLVAVLAGGAAGWAVTTQVMEARFAFEPVSAALVISGGLLITLLAGLVFAAAPLAARPARVLRSAE